MYDAQRHPAKIAELVVDFATVDMEDVGIGTDKNDAIQPSIEPMLPMTKGIAMPCMHFFVTFKSGDNFVHCVVLLGTRVISDDDDKRANTSDAGRKILQHHSYEKCSVGTLGKNLTACERFEIIAEDNNVITCPPPDLNIVLSVIPISVDRKSVPPAAKSLANGEFDKAVGEAFFLL